MTTKSVRPLIRTPYDGTAEAFSLASGISFPEPKDEPFSALQSDLDQCDLNKIVERQDLAAFERFSDRVHKGHYVDLGKLPDFQTSLQIVIDAEEAFLDLPASLRKKFDNDPAEFLAFVEQADRADLAELGLLDPSSQPPLPPSNSKVSASDSVDGPSEASE